MAAELWEIENGPVSGDIEGEFVTVRYSIRYPRGTFEVLQRVRNSSAGYAEAYERVNRMVGGYAGDLIRNSKNESDDGSWGCARWLRELAAQLAEANERERARDAKRKKHG
jgi:hypothetical protein